MLIIFIRHLMIFIIRQPILLLLRRIFWDILKPPVATARAWVIKLFAAKVFKIRITN
mgnify:CR=1 FL=1